MKASKTCPALTRSKSFQCDGAEDACNDDDCCEMDQSLCGGITVTCPTNHVEDTTKSGNTWSDPSTDCCSSKQKGADYTCENTAYEKKKNSPATWCDGINCKNDECCEDDSTKCRPTYSC